MRGWTIYAALCISMSCWGQGVLPAKQPSPFNVLQIHSGHSLTDPLFYPHWPGQYINLMNHVLGEWAGDYVGKSTIPGSPMWWRWENPPCCGDPDARHDISDWELLSITEGVPLFYEGGGTQEWYEDAIIDQREHLSMFTNNAWENGNGGSGAPTLLWTTWTNIDDSDGPWRQMLDIQGAEWENMQDFANDSLLPGSPPVYIIPGHKMMARLYDDIQDGLVPDVTDISDFFSDNIHTNELGAYAIAMIHYACIFNTSPVGLPNNLLPGAPAGTPIPSEDLATYLQNMIWQEVTTYPRTGIYQSLNTEVVQLDVTKYLDQVSITFEIDIREEIHQIDIEHSGKDQKYRVLTTLHPNGTGHLSHQLIHDDPLTGDNYYRLKIVHKDGEYEYSTIRVVHIYNNNWKVYPNPAKAIIRITGDFQKAPVIVLKNLHGTVVWKSTSSLEIPVEQIPGGLYIVEISDGIQFAYEKIVVSK